MGLEPCRHRKQDLDFGIPDPHPKDSTGRFVHGGRIYAAHEATGRREHKPWHAEKNLDRT